MQKSSKALKKSDRLPKYWSYERKLLNEFLLESEEYEESVKKGLPFFTPKELSELKTKYHGGISWKEIDEELSKKGMIFKKATFRKYIQEKKIPPTISYRATKKGREAQYPADMIEHINFIQYFYRIAGNKLIDRILEIFSHQTISAKNAIEEQLWGTNLREAVFTYLRDSGCEGDDLHQAIPYVFDHDPELYQKVQSGLDEIYNAFHEKFNEWVKMLESLEIPISDKE